MPRSTVATTLRRLDPWGPVLAAAAVVVFLLRGFGDDLNRDLALYAYSAQQVAEGVPPYVAVLNRAGPLAHLVPGLWTLLGRQVGADDLMAMRVGMMVLSVLAVWVTYLLGRDLHRSRWAGLVAGTTLLTFQGFVTYATGGPREKTTALLLVACGLLLLVHRRWLLVGVCTALATLTWQPAFVLLAAATLVASLGGRGRAIPGAWLRWSLGGVLATAVVVGWFWAVGALFELYEGFWLVNATHTTQTPMLDYLQRSFGHLYGGFGWSLWVMLLGLVASVAGGLAALRRLDRDDTPRVARVALGAATLASFGWSLSAFNGWADAIFAMPLAAAGIAGLAVVVARRLPARSGPAVVAVVCATGLVAAGATAYAARSPQLTHMQAEIDAAFAVVGPEATVQSIGAPQALVLRGLTNPIRHQMFGNGLRSYVDETVPGGLRGIATDLEAARPTFVTVGDPDGYGWLTDVIRDSYARVGRTRNFVWLADRELGPDVLGELRSVLAGRARPSPAAVRPSSP